MIEYGGTPADWVTDRGRPAKALGDGFPSYESDDGTLVVMDLLVAFGTTTGGMQLFSRSYGHACLSTGGLVWLHEHASRQVMGVVREWDGRYGEEPFDSEEAVSMGLPPMCVEEAEVRTEPPTMWRPLVRYLSMDRGWVRMGSQQELAWRFGLHEVSVQRARAFMAGVEDSVKGTCEALVREWSMTVASDRAKELLREHLTAQQRIELESLGHFRVRGGSGAMYSVEPSNGFFLLDAVTSEPVASFCLHPEEWIPHEDVALATKFALEDSELEGECLAGARRTDIGYTSRPTGADLVAARYERELPW